MKTEERPPETDQEPGAPHPRAVLNLVGHVEQEQVLREAFGGGRMHHAWLLSGPKGIGKATLAYRFARWVLGARMTGPRPLDADAEDLVTRHVAAGSHPDLFVLRRGLNDKGKPRREITIDDARELSRFFSLAPSEGGWRVAIVDAVDDLNRNAANALLKTLEEPPARSVLLLLCHAPGATLATIRSRCRRLALRAVDNALVQQALGPDSARLLALANGRPGRAIALEAQGLTAIMGDLDNAEAIIARGDSGPFLRSVFDTLKGEPFERLGVLLELAGEWARALGVRQGGEAWAEAWSNLEVLRAEAEGLDMDPRHALARAISVLDRAATTRKV